MTNDEWAFLATCVFLVLLAGIGVSYSYYYARKQRAGREQQPPTPPITIDRTPQSVVITITLPPATNPPRTG